MATRLHFAGTRAARGSFRLDVWSAAQQAWVPNCFYREIDWSAVDRRVININSGVGDVRLVDVRSGVDVGVWVNGVRLGAATGKMAVVR